MRPVGFFQKRIPHFRKAQWSARAFAPRGIDGLAWFEAAVKKIAAHRSDDGFHLVETAGQNLFQIRYLPETPTLVIFTGEFAHGQQDIHHADIAFRLQALVGGEERLLFRFLGIHALERLETSKSSASSTG